MSQNLFNDLTKLYASGGYWRKFFFWARWQLCPFEELVKMLPPAAHLAEFGCGIGIFSNLAALLGAAAQITGFDDNPQSISVAQSTVKARPGIAFIHKDVRSLDLTGQFDAVAMIDVLHHIPTRDQPEALKIAWRALKPEGTLLLKDIDEKPVWMVWASRLHDLVQAHPPFFRSHQELVDLLKMNGFEIREERQRTSWYVPHIAFLAKKV